MRDPYQNQIIYTYMWTSTKTLVQRNYKQISGNAFEMILSEANRKEDKVPEGRGETRKTSADQRTTAQVIKEVV